MFTNQIFIVADSSGFSQPFRSDPSCAIKQKQTDNPSGRSVRLPFLYHNQTTYTGPLRLKLAVQRLPPIELIASSLVFISNDTLALHENQTAFNQSASWLGVDLIPSPWFVSVIPDGLASEFCYSRYSSASFF